jgi:hypothetical protein
MFKFLKNPSFAVVLLVCGCTTIPSGPDVMALPGIGLSFEQFKSDDASCESYASSQVGSNATGEEEELQQRYDMAYIQCMYGKGHRVPVSGSFSDVGPASSPDATTTIPQPPEGTPPPPPPSKVPAFPK